MGQKLARSILRWLETPVMRLVTAVVVAAALVLSIVTSARQAHQDSEARQESQRTKVFVSCVASWANAVTVRTQALSGSSDPRNDALVKLIKDLAAKKTDAVQGDLDAYFKADADYQQIQKTHPVPPAPAFTCH